ncbi:PqqD family protein [Calorimonas adulescens]|jgi:Coenzyme PQQ synthesis protein D (PqqD).|uniref:PqqD family protein n=1 Tax=Calorimonas adulescens TaxID=2606906 RepID=A0A5D8QBH8_9THEO|nr:PqqD family protein [Calorimonas adulescens]TZE81707.1 PqqD family protein [Calorimonas adulescens]
MRKKEDKNFLEFIPKRRNNVNWRNREDGNVTLIIERNKLAERVLAFMFNAPKTITLDLDRLGSRVWTLCDGEKSIATIGLIIEREFGDEAKPTYERLIKFIQLLNKNGLIDISSE